MGKKLDALLGRSFKPSKLKGTARLAVSRLPTLKSQRQARCSTARSDVVQFLQSGNHERALLRVEQVIKEQNMLDVFVALEGYCHLLVERINLFEQHKFCPDELLEAVSTLIYASTRCGEFPELLELRAIFTSKFGKEFAMRAVELRNNCGVNPRIIQKLSTRMPSLEQKMEVIKEIASDNNIQLDQLPTPEAKHQEDSPALGVGKNEGEEIERGPRRKYKDVADAAQAAFESAAYAAAAARAAVELSRTESTDDSTTPRGISKVHEDKGMEESSKTASVRRSVSSSDSSDDEGDGDVKDKNLVFDESDEGSRRDEFGLGREGVEPLNIHRRPISVRTISDRTTWARVR